MEIVESKKGNITILALHGELMGGEEAQPFQQKIYEAVENEKLNLILDMEHVKWMNSSGLGMIMGALTTLRSGGGELCMINVSERVRRPIEVTRLDSVIHIYGDLEEAAASFREEE